MFDDPEYRNFVARPQRADELAGTPPFDVASTSTSDEALSFEELRREVMAVAQEGVELQRFKGLGEMNADQLCDTTMDPATRTLQQVTIDDAASPTRSSRC